MHVAKMGPCKWSKLPWWVLWGLLRIGRVHRGTRRPAAQSPSHSHVYKAGPIRFWINLSYKKIG